ncbi:MAG: hypothetical protein IIZ92_02095, partial [Aquincola sp.]|nr:hypothetical protein [Aquincola sp.]
LMPALAATPSAPSALADVLDAPVQPSSAKPVASGIDRQGDRFIAVGARGAIFVSTDGAATWSQSASPTRADLVGVRISDASVAWAVGPDGIALRSADGGKSWQRMLDGRSVLKLLTAHYGELARAGDEAAQRMLKEVEGAASQSATPGVLPSPFFDVWFADANEGLLVGAFGLILHTRDGGRHWTPLMERTDNERHFHLYGVQGHGADRWVAGEQGLLLHWNPESGRFVKVETPYNGTFFGLSVQPGAVVVFGLRGNAYVSRDNGAQWTKIDTGVDANLVAALPLGAGRILLVSQAGHLLTTDVDGRKAVQLKTGVPAGEVLGAVATGSGRVVLARPAGILAVDLPRPAP